MYIYVNMSVLFYFKYILCYSRKTMPNTSSAKKALRQSDRRRVQNVRHKHVVADATKQIRKLVEAGKREEAAALLPRAYKEIDKAAKTGVLKRNTAARKKSGAARLVTTPKSK